MDPTVENPSSPNQQLRSPLDPASVKILKKAIEQFLPDLAVNLQWENYFYFASVFESIDRYTVVTGLGAVIVSPGDGLDITTGAALSDASLAGLDMSPGTVVSYNKQTRFRTSIQIDDPTNTKILVTTLNDSQGYIGFFINAGAIKGVATPDGITLTEIGLGTMLANTWYTLELRYLPQNKIVFYVNGVQLGVLTKGFPTGAGGSFGIFNATLINLDSNGHDLNVSYFEYLQHR